LRFSRTGRLRASHFTVSSSQTCWRCIQRGTDVVDYERSRPGEGFSVPYSATGGSVTLIVYDRRLPLIDEGSETSVVTHEYEAAKRSVIHGVHLGLYASAELVAETRIPESGQQFRCARYKLDLATRATLSDSVVCLAGWRNKFVKVRVTTPSAQTETIDVFATVRDLARQLWPRT
jgi:hypothetical protein